MKYEVLVDKKWRTPVRAKLISRGRLLYGLRGDGPYIGGGRVAEPDEWREKAVKPPKAAKSPKPVIIDPHLIKLIGDYTKVGLIQ